jgi:beta-mannanase
LESRIGRTLAIDNRYVYWDIATAEPSVLSEFLQDDAAHGRTPLISWNCSQSNASIASGAADATIVAFARAVASTGRTAFVRYMWEMDGPDTVNGRKWCYDPATDLPDGRFSPTAFIAAWNHIRGIFAAQGATNVVWVWNPTCDPAKAKPYFPGAAETDWIGFDCYPSKTTSTLADTIGKMYAAFAPDGLPLMLAETAAKSAPASVQPTYLGPVANTLRTEFPAVKAFVYFDGAGQGANATESWGLSPQGTTAFKLLGSKAYMGG